jgi:hypothetical protein
MNKKLKFIEIDPGKEIKANIKCDCKSNNTFYTGSSICQDADVSRGLPIMEGDQVYCKDCGKVFWY